MLIISLLPRFRKILRMGNGDNIREKTKKLRTKTMTHFILALSDQQPVTGLAILVTAYYQGCKISGYHFKLAVNLAWFSSTTHLSTLAVLQGFLIRHPTLKYLRVIGIFSVLGILFHAELYFQWFVALPVPAQCTFEMGFAGLNNPN